MDRHSLNPNRAAVSACESLYASSSGEILIQTIVLRGACSTPLQALAMDAPSHGPGGVHPPQSAFHDIESHMMSDDFSFGSPFSPSGSGAHDGVLGDSIFPEMQPGLGGENPEELQRQDPLAAQIWRLYTKTKAQLPNQERMENLTWRMMAMSLKRKEREQARYVCVWWLD